jgi:putative phosphoribosyl transferase
LHVPQERFSNRREAGWVLAQKLIHYKNRSEVIVLALPRGGVPVGYEIARELHAPLDVFVVRKLGVPWHTELAMGAIASDGVEILNGDVVTAYNIPSHVIREVAEQETRELQRRLATYRGERPLPTLTGQIVMLVDDGLATGSTMRAAVSAARQKRPRAVVVAVPVAAINTCLELKAEVDDIVCLRTPHEFRAVGESGMVEMSDLPEVLHGRKAPPNGPLFDGLPTLDELERRYLLHVLDAAAGSRTRAAEILGIDRRTLYRMAERFGIQLKD